MNHLTQEQSLNYISGQMDEETSFEVDQHLAACNRCVDRVRALRMLRSDFDTIWDSWTAKSHAEAYINARVKEALSQTAEVTDSPEMQLRVLDLLKGLPQKTESALGIVMDTAKKTAHVFQEGLEGLFRPEAFFRFSPVPVTATGIRVLGEREKAAITVKTSGPPWKQVTIDPSIRKVTVRADMVPKPWPLVLLVPKRTGMASIKEFRQPEGEEFLLAEFEELSDDEYVLLLEAPEKR